MIWKISIIQSVTGTTGIHSEMLHAYLWDSISVRDTAVRTNMKENSYHGMLLGLLRSQGRWLVKSNAETGEGYSDISIQIPEWIGIVVELKYANDGNLEVSCKEALDQIEEKKYGEGFKAPQRKKDHQIRDCVLWERMYGCYGIMFVLRHPFVLPKKQVKGECWRTFTDVAEGAFIYF